MGISGEPNIVGKSIYIVNDGVGKMYLFEDESKQDIGSYKILVEGTSVVDPLTRGVYSNNYRDELPKEAGSLGLTDGDVVIEGSTLGKKMMGFKNGMDKSENPTYYQNINEYLNGGDGKPAASTDYNFVVADWKDLSYNLTIHAGYNSSSGEEVVIPINDVLYGDTWANVIAQISRSGYTLKKLTETKGGTDAVYEAEIVWDENYINKTVTPTYPKGSNVTQWDEAGQNVLNIDLYAEWQGEPVNTLVKFQNTNDAGASLDAMNNLSVVYADPEVGNITISEYGSVNGEYTFKAVANEELNFSFKLDNGYVVSDNGVSITGGVDSVSGDAPIISYSYSEDTKIHTINIKGIVAEDAQITIEIEREEIAIPVTAQHFNLSLSGHDSATTSISTTGDGQYTITTKVGESFNLVATTTGNYEFDTYQVNGLTQVNAPTGDTGAEKTFAITVETFNSPSIVISAKERLFTASIDFVYDSYTTDGNAKPGTISIQCGEQVVSTGEDASWSNLMVNDPVVITVTNNEYYVINNLTVSGGSAVLNKTSDTTWELTGVVGGETYTITAEFNKAQYTATYTGGFAFSGNSPTPILDAEGSPVDDASQIITFGGKTTYNYGEELTLSFDLISQYYEFVGWYYSNGVLISSDPEDTLTAPASNLNIYGVIKGKTATVTINTGTYYELAGEIKNANKNLVTVSNGVSTITFTYAQPNSGTFNLQTLAGYGVSRVLIGPSSANIANGESGFYLFGTGNSFAGYLSAYQNNAEILNLFTQSGWHIELLARPYSAQVVFQAGADATGVQVSDVYYYDQPIDVTTIMAGFSKTGHTGSGWEFTLSGNKYNVTDESLLSEVAGKVTIKQDAKYFYFTIASREGDIDYEVKKPAVVLVKNGETVEPGTQLTAGAINPADLLRMKGVKGLEDYLLSQVIATYRGQGVAVNDKHVEIIIRQMLKKVKVESAGDTSLLPGEIVDVYRCDEENERVLQEGGVPATVKRILLGITKASLSTESFLSAASFQETSRTLTDAAVKGKIDKLLGLKENVIIGKLIPAGTGIKEYRSVMPVVVEDKEESVDGIA